MATLDRDGVAIHYEVHGQGPAILLSHGYSATCRMWDGQIAALRDRYRSSSGTCAVTARATTRPILPPIQRLPRSATWPPSLTPPASSAP